LRSIHIETNNQLKLKMKLFIVLSALVAIASAGYAGHHYAAPVVHHAPAIVKHHTVVQPVVRHSSHVVQEPALFQKTIAVPASIPAVIPRVSHSTATVPEHRFSRQDWIQPGPIYQTPAVRQHTIHRQIPVQYESVRSIPTLSYSHHTRPVAIKTAVAVPASIPATIHAHGHYAAAPAYGAYGHDGGHALGYGIGGFHAGLAHGGYGHGGYGHGYGY